MQFKNLHNRRPFKEYYFFRDDHLIISKKTHEIYFLQ